jgi:hypothetical protein
MPIPAYNSKDLVAISTVIASAARQLNWDGDLDNNSSVKVEEVQCMRMGESLYFACNKGEHVAVANLFSAFGVIDHATLVSCVRYCNAILGPDYSTSKRKKKFGKGYTLKYSGPEQQSFRYAGLPAQFPALTVTEMADAHRLITGATLPLTATAQESRIAWCLRKFTEAGAMTNLARQAKTKSLLLHTYNAGANEINIINDSREVHAELKLLRILTESKLGVGSFNPHTQVALGGLKKACAYCNAWIGFYKPWIKAQYRVDLETPQTDNRDEGGGEGDRPEIDKTHLSRFGLYVGTLFDGKKNDMCTSVGLHQDSEW